MKKSKTSNSEMTIYCIDFDSNRIREKGWVGPSLLEFYESDLKRVLQSKEELIDWIVNETDCGEVAKFLCEIFYVDSVGKALATLDAMSEDAYKQKIVPPLLEKLKQPHDWENDDNYSDCEVGSISPYCCAACELRKLPQDLIYALRLDFDDSDYWAMLGAGVDEANKILESRGENFRFEPE